MTKSQKIKGMLIGGTVVVMALLLLFVGVNNRESIDKIEQAKYLKEEPRELLSFVAYNSRDEVVNDILIVANSENGIEYITMPDGNKIFGNDKSIISIDYTVNKGTEYTFKIKERDKSEVEKRLILDDNMISNTTLSIEKVKDAEGYKVVEIKNKMKLPGFETYYKIGENGEWVEGNGKISILDYDVTQEGLINEDNTVTVYAKVENENTSYVVSKSIKYAVDTSSIIQNFQADSIIDAMEKFDFGTGKFKIEVNGKEYNVKVYSFDEDLEIDTDTAFGSSKDVATRDVDAQNMVVVKVNGNLTIDANAKLTAYSSPDGYGGPKGMLVYCTGTLINNGTISMTGKGARAEGEEVYLWKNLDGSYEFVPEDGATGGAGIPSRRSFTTNGNKGNDGTGRSTGGGGTGCGRSFDRPIAIGAGGQGNSYSGGSGSGASNSDGEGISWGTGASADVTTKGREGSAGVVRSGNGSGYGQISLGGIGNPTGSYATYRSGVTTYNQNNGTGGLLIIYANKLQNNNKIEANGVTTGNITSNYNGGYRIDAGGSSGGGSVNIFYKQLESRGTITANGGAAAQLTGGARSGAGGNGTVSIGSILSGTYEEN